MLTEIGSIVGNITLSKNVFLCTLREKCAKGDENVARCSEVAASSSMVERVLE